MVRIRILVVCFVISSLYGSGFAQDRAPTSDWSQEQIARLPASEKPIRLFNGQDLTGWQGQTGKYFSVRDGIIIAKNNKEDAPQASTYLLTQDSYRNFRLIFESKLVTSEMHSGIALWGTAVEKQGDPFSYQGHLVMYPSNYGYWDLYRRNSIYKDKDQVARRAGHQHDWNRMEILAIGNRIRHVINGQLVADWSDPKPELCQRGPIGLQLHSNRVAQEVHFRGLVLTKDPEDQLVTVDKDSARIDMNRATLAKIPERMSQFVADNRFSGVVTLVARKGRIVHLDAVGKRDVENDLPMRTDTVFGIASMTKPITATAVMILQDAGKLSVDDPVSKYIPRFKKTSLKSGPSEREITLRDLMTHTSGVVGSQQNQGSLKETIEMVADRPLGFQPGSKWAYSPGLSVCGSVIEIVSGQTFDEFLREQIFGPLGMVDTSFHPNSDQQSRLAKLYRPGEKKNTLQLAKHWLTELTADRTPNPSGGLFSTARDMARFYQMILNGGQLNGRRIVSPAAVREMTKVQTGKLKTGFTPGNGWGLGWCVIREPQGATQALSPGSFGHGGAFGTQGWVDPHREMIFVLLMQRTGFGNSDASDIRSVFQKLAVDALPM